MKSWIAGLVAVAVTIACSVNPVTERPQLMLISENQIIESSYQAYAGMVAKAQSQTRLNRDDQLTQRVRDIAYRLIPHAVKYKPAIINWRWEVHVFSDEEPNAFCMAGGKIVVNSGLITRLKPTDDELAQVISHEIAHALSEHTREKISVGIAAGILTDAVAIAAKMDSAQGAALGALTELAITLPNSRAAESEADRIGLILATKAGYNPEAAASLWKKMKAAGAGQSFALLSTHPTADDRIEALQQEASKLQGEYAKAKPLREANALPKIVYEKGQATNLYQKATYDLPQQPQKP